MLASILAFHLLVAVLVDHSKVVTLDTGSFDSRAACDQARSALVLKLAATGGVIDAHGRAFATACKTRGIET